MIIIASAFPAWPRALTRQRPEDRPRGHRPSSSPTSPLTAGATAPDRRQARTVLATLAVLTYLHGALHDHHSGTRHPARRGDRRPGRHLHQQRQCACPHPRFRRIRLPRDWLYRDPVPLRHRARGDRRCSGWACCWPAPGAPRGAAAWPGGDSSSPAARPPRPARRATPSSTSATLPAHTRQTSPAPAGSAWRDRTRPAPPDRSATTAPSRRTAAGAGCRAWSSPGRPAKGRPPAHPPRTPPPIHRRKRNRP